MKKFILYIKGVLLYSTAFICLVFLSGIDSIFDMDIDYFLMGILICISLIYLCLKTISEEDFKILSLYNWLEHKLKQN